MSAYSAIKAAAAAIRHSGAQIDAGLFEGLFGVLERESTDRTSATNLLETLHAAHVVVDSDCLAEAEAA